MKHTLKFVLLFAVMFSSYQMDARKPDKKEGQNVKPQFTSSLRADCQQAQAQIDMEVNNVRARLLTGGDLWWDLQNGRYIVPKPAPGFDEVSSIYAGGVWIGGVDPAGNIKLAGVQYANSGNTDWYPGPLDGSGQTEQEICEDWDQFFVVNGDEIRKHISRYNKSIEDGVPMNCDSIPDEVKYWPGKGNPYWNEEFDFPIPDQNLGNFWDVNGDTKYNACEGDFPIIIIRDCEPKDAAEARELLPDQMVFWIYNDNGGLHRLSSATPIQMEVQVQAFAYSTNDEINDMTFYRYKLINKATDDIRDCYFAMWADMDLGCSDDDYIGVDVDRSLAYTYNEDALDGSPGTSCPFGVNTYKDEVPVVGIDYFRGPRGPKIFCRDVDGNVMVDTSGAPLLCNPPVNSGEQDTLVELGMTSFIYQNRQGAGEWPEATTDPERDFEFYNILQGFWKDGTALTFGESGYSPGEVDSVKFAFTGAPNDENGWSMCTADLGFGDRRTVQATGPLLLQPGAENELIIGVVWVPNIVYDCPDISRLQVADDLAQALFNACFDIVDGPDAPDICGVELDQQLILMLSNDTLKTESNNAKEQYTERDLLAAENGAADSLYRFEGYKVYQLANPNVTVGEFGNIELSRIIRQVDVKNGVSEIYNWSQVPNPDFTSEDKIFVPEIQVEGADAGIMHSFNITQDQFADGDKRLINHKNYYFSVVAYGYNNYKQFDPITLEEDKGQQKPYLEGRKNVKTYTYTPRPIIYKDLQSAYGQEAVVTRLDGVGTGLNALDIADEERTRIFEAGDSFNGVIEYKRGNAPINARITDPLNIKDGSYRLEVVGDYNENTNVLQPGAFWKLTNLTTDKVITSEKTLEDLNEQLVYGEGFSVSVNQVGEPGDGFNEDNGGIAQSVTYKDPNATNWFSAVPAFRGIEFVVDAEEEISIFRYPFVEPDSGDDEVLANIDNGLFIPLKLARWSTPTGYLTPAWRARHGFAESQNALRLQDLNNVDIVLTSDKTLWSECIVIETAVSDYNLSNLETQAEPGNDIGSWDLRDHASIDQNGNEIEGRGKSYFPGYAIDVESGERLNIFFGENSVYNDDNEAVMREEFPDYPFPANIGGDMIWNPSGILNLPRVEALSVGVPNLYSDFVGAQHYIYVTKQKYDGCAAIHEQLGKGNLFDDFKAYSMVTWTALPLPSDELLPLSEGLIPNETVIKLRVTNPFGKETTLSDLTNPTSYESVGGLPVYEFNFNGAEAKELAEAKYDSALSQVRVVPNPYYAYSAYENREFDNTVKVTNLPANAVVTIYTLDGKFIQQFNRNASPSRKGGSNPAVLETQITPNLEWNLKNNKGIPVASGVYIFHISAPDLGLEKSIKWFGVNRRFDPSSL